MPLLPPEADLHIYQPLPEDIQKIKELDALVINGLGHDGFVDAMIKAAGRLDLKLIKPNDGVPLVPPQEAFEKVLNSHTFLSITSAVHQINNLLAAVERLDPTNASLYRRNARVYKRRLRNQLANALGQLEGIDVNAIRIGTVHDSYTYLLDDLGIKTTEVIQPRHGMQPSAKQLADTITRLKRAKIDILFAEMDYEQKFVQIVREETGTRIVRLSHISKGVYSASMYEEQMALNLRQVVRALRKRA